MISMYDANVKERESPQSNYMKRYLRSMLCSVVVLVLISLTVFFGNPEEINETRRLTVASRPSPRPTARPTFRPTASPTRQRFLSVFAGIYQVSYGNIGNYNGENLVPTQTKLCHPTSVVFDSSNNLYYADNCNGLIRKYSPSTGRVTTFAGKINGIGSTADGIHASQAALNPYKLALDAAGNMYVSESDNYRIRRIAANTMIVTTILGTGVSPLRDYPNNSAGLAVALCPKGITFDNAGNLYVGCGCNHKIYKLSLATGRVTTYAGIGTYGLSGDNGPAIAAKLYNPTELKFDSSFTALYLTDTNNNRIRKITHSTGVITTVYAPSTCTIDDLCFPNSLDFDIDGNLILGSAKSVKKYSFATNTVATITESNAVAYNPSNTNPNMAYFTALVDVAVDRNGIIYAVDQYANVIFRVN